MATQKRKSSFVEAILLLVLALFLSVYSKHNRGVMQIGSWVVNGMLYPIQLVQSGITNGVGDVLTEYIVLKDLRRENKLLNKEILDLKKKHVKYKELRVESRKLYALLKIKDPKSEKTQVARVVAYDPSNWSEVITIDKGASDGLFVGQAVVVDSGLVGQISEVGLTSSQVLLISDRRSSVDVFSQRTRVRGTVDGTGLFRAKWEFVFAAQDVKVDDLLLTSGLDGIYPAGIVVAKVKTVKPAESGSLFDEIKVIPSVDFSKLEYVLVLENK